MNLRLAAASLFVSTILVTPLSLAPVADTRRLEAISPRGAGGAPVSGEKQPHAYHSEPPHHRLPKTLDPKEFAGDQAAFAAYTIAAKIPKVLYQEPCHCLCDRLKGHSSLFDCYLSRHGKSCHICQIEVLFIYQQHRLGKQPAEIRSSLDEGSYSRLGLDHYVKAYYANGARTMH